MDAELHTLARAITYSKNRIFKSSLHLYSEAHFEVDVQTLKSVGAPEKDRLLDRLIQQGPPSRFRLIHCKSTSQQGRVVLVDWHHHQHISYTAVSHTWGAEVYSVFDCECTNNCTAAIPRCSSTPCPGAAAHSERHIQVVKDILKMCERLKETGSEYVWHDGVCIAQHNAEEVEESIRHMGWIYANASDTVIFLDYVGRPVTLLPLEDPYETRWDRRVWTLQEAILSCRRRYCIRLLDFSERGDDLVYSGRMTMENFEARLAQCYADESCIQVIEEEAFWDQLLSLCVTVLLLSKNVCTPLSDAESEKAVSWLCCMNAWICLLRGRFFLFPSLAEVIQECAGTRDSKHEGDRINAVLGLAGITDFVAPKDGNFESSTIEFIKRLGQKGLREALFWVNFSWKKDADKRHTWVPCLSRQFFSASARFRSKAEEASTIRCSVLENGMLEMRGEMRLVASRFTIRNDNVELSSQDVSGLNAHSTYLSMNLTEQFNFGEGEDADDEAGYGFKAFAEASSTIMGRCIFPVSWDIQPWDSRSCRTSSECRECTETWERPVVQGRAMEEGSMFWAHLVFADFAFVDKSEGQCSALALVIIATSDNDLQAVRPVSKLGFFQVNALLSSLIFEKKLIPVTTLDHLIID